MQPCPMRLPEQKKRKRRGKKHFIEAKVKRTRAERTKRNGHDLECDVAVFFSFFFTPSYFLPFRHSFFFFLLVREGVSRSMIPGGNGKLWCSCSYLRSHPLTPQNPFSPSGVEGGEGGWVVPFPSSFPSSSPALASFFFIFLFFFFTFSFFFFAL